jgi:hypothetical protein|tara:strand:+ start:1175 stop:1525 length:351 start_codon:yes stop_codon:yes gene_type:complete
MENGEYKTKRFTSKDDVWDVMRLIREETESFNEKGNKSFDVAESIRAQLPFFSCPNIILDQKAQDDISRYVYCEKFNTPAYGGSFGEHPSKWIHKSYVISYYMNRKQQKSLEKKNG